VRKTLFVGLVMLLAPAAALGQGAAPGSDGYSPLWSVNPYDNADFDGVVDLSSVMAANVLAEGVASVNCPVVDTGG
jgi:hypothetical protein